MNRYGHLLPTIQRSCSAARFRPQSGGYLRAKHHRLTCPAGSSDALEIAASRQLSSARGRWLCTDRDSASYRARLAEQRVSWAEALMLGPDVHIGELHVPAYHRQRRVTQQLLEGEDVAAGQDEPFRSRVAEGVR